VRRNRDRYEALERMHWSCFHYAFEHNVDDPDADADIACGDPSCPARAFDPSPTPIWRDD
jgi:hypothetical protein